MVTEIECRQQVQQLIIFTLKITYLIDLAQKEHNTFPSHLNDTNTGNDINTMNLKLHATENNGCDYLPMA